METTVIAIDSPDSFAGAVSAAAQCLRAGGVAAVPTETVYGLAASALSENAVREIYRVKGRPSHNPLIVHVCSLAMARNCTTSWPPAAAALAQAFWPGPFTMVLPKSPQIPHLVTAGGDTVAIRWPAHPFMRALIEACAFPLAAPSANLANQVSPTEAAHVRQSLHGKIPLIIDAGPAVVGIESTVVQLLPEGWRLLRPGSISLHQIQRVLGSAPLTRPAGDKILASPGQLRRHYSPRATLRILSWQNEPDLEEQARATGLPLPTIHVLAYDQIPRNTPFGRVAVIPNDPEAYARALYAELHRCDAEGARLILVEQLPPAPEWDGIRDRLTRAAAQD